MLNPWQWCDSDDEAVADFLAATVQGVIENGGWIHPGARLISREGELHIECDADDGEPLVRLPTSALLPINRIDWGTGSEALSISAIGDWPSSADLSLQLTQIGLHNACEKLPRLVTSHPSATTDLATEVINAVRALRPSFRMRPMTPTEIFWATRTVKLPAFSDAAEPVAVPIVDLLDHHPDGAVAQWRDGSFTVPVSHPTGTSACFLDYGLHRDALDMAVVYGFADSTLPLVHCGPLEAMIPGLGVLRVLDQGRSPSGDLLPLVAHRVDGGWDLNRFTFADRKALAFDLGPELQEVTGWSDAKCDHALCSLAIAMMTHLDRLDTALEENVASPATDILASASRHTRGVLTSRIESRI